jgi:PhnB protein
MNQTQHSVPRTSYFVPLHFVPLTSYFLAAIMKDQSQDTPSAAIVPMLYMKDVSAALAFYKKAFGAVERWRIGGDPEGNVHVAEMTIPPVIFRLHEGEVSPSASKTSVVVIGLLVHDPDALASSAVAAGATELSPMRDYEYGYRQGTFIDPFGHQWCLEKMGDLMKVPKISP